MIVLAVIIAFGLMILVHEFGHFWMAKLMGVRVEQFYLGFGPELVGFKRGPTRYGLRLIPLGGYVKLAGDNPKEELKNEPWEFLSQPWYRRLPVIAAGPFMNFVLAIVVFWIVFMQGIPVADVNSTRIGEVIKGEPAWEAGFKPGDKIISVDGKETKIWQDVSLSIRPNAEKLLSIKVLRDDKILTFKVTPKYNVQAKAGLIGIVCESTMQKINPFAALIEGVKQTLFWIVLTLKAIWMMLVGAIKPDIAGPIGIVQLISQQAKTGLANLLYLIGIINVNLGLINLFPIPILDGGWLVIFVIEGIRKKRLSARAMEIAQTIGLSLIIFLLLFATRNDIFRLLRGGK